MFSSFFLPFLVTLVYCFFYLFLFYFILFFLRNFRSLRFCVFAFLWFSVVVFFCVFQKMGENKISRFEPPFLPLFSNEQRFQVSNNLLSSNHRAHLVRNPILLTFLSSSCLKVSLTVPKKTLLSGAKPFPLKQAIKVLKQTLSLKTFSLGLP